MASCTAACLEEQLLPDGREIDRFCRITPPVDDGRPEAWVRSDTCTLDTGKSGNPYDGYALCFPRLLSVILAKPAGARYPGTPGRNGEE